MGEFELIDSLFRPLAASNPHPDLLLGPGDDCAIQRLPPGHDLVFSVDTLVEGVHFPADYNPRYLGWRSLAVAASDLAAMGATPVCFTLALTLPAADPAWLQPFTEGLQAAALSFGMTLAGGDTTRGPLVLSLQVHGSVPAGRALTRKGARPGDLICVSGPLGGAAAALPYLSCLSAADNPAAPTLLEHYHHPQPRLKLGQWLQGRATACIDVSDGLLADLGHILRASGVGARLTEARIPRVAGASLENALRGGDDYELCFTLPAGYRDELLASPEGHQGDGTAPAVIGEVVAGPGVVIGQPDGRQRSVSGPGGYDHFGVRR